MENTQSKVRKEVTRSAITCTALHTSSFQKESTVTAELRQTVKTTSFYPSKSVANSRQSGIFTATDFGFTEQPFENEETKVAFVLVPAGLTVEQVNAKLESDFKNACLYTVKSNHPITTEEQEYAIENNMTTLAKIANTQIIRYPKTHEHAGNIVLTKSAKVQYRMTYFSDSIREDEDLRNSNPEDVYMSTEIKQEVMAGEAVTPGATIM